ncbi:MAG: hypothetical protein KKB81_06680 [Candidatus Margulisbacteria bacterium]|nr:hypothetical protein [Candidatus Margulisiibacteriota bacterium]MBU1022482.1 hypothetical protein [Candidatus Margulisiibacteriota bacterium]MBU1954613.1 hypothetical protein [Candidatus Margulisiibacteriota bacterium]
MAIQSNVKSNQAIQARRLDMNQLRSQRLTDALHVNPSSLNPKVVTEALAALCNLPALKELPIQIRGSAPEDPYKKTNLAEKVIAALVQRNPSLAKNKSELLFQATVVLYELNNMLTQGKLPNTAAGTFNFPETLFEAAKGNKNIRETVYNNLVAAQRTRSKNPIQAFTKRDPLAALDRQVANASGSTASIDPAVAEEVHEEIHGGLEGNPLELLAELQGPEGKNYITGRDIAGLDQELALLNGETLG